LFQCALTLKREFQPLSWEKGRWKKLIRRQTVVHPTIPIRG
jgi:hypothetical protein